MSRGPPRSFRERFGARPREPGGFGIYFERSSDVDPVAVGERRIGGHAASMDREPEPRYVELVLSDETRLLDGFGNRRASRKLDRDNVLYGGGCPDDRHVHGSLA
jgi:hypothetical protein